MVKAERVSCVGLTGLLDYSDLKERPLGGWTHRIARTGSGPKLRCYLWPKFQIPIRTPGIRSALYETMRDMVSVVIQGEKLANLPLSALYAFTFREEKLKASGITGMLAEKPCNCYLWQKVLASKTPIRLVRYRTEYEAPERMDPP
jgi:hypothetical protein